MEMTEYRSASCAVPPMAWPIAGQMFSSRPVVRPNSPHVLKCRILRNKQKNANIDFQILASYTNPEALVILAMIASVVISTPIKSNHYEASEPIK